MQLALNSGPNDAPPDAPAPPDDAAA